MHPIIHLSNHPFVHSPTHPLTHTFIHPPIRSSTDPSIHPHPSILSIHPYIHSSSQSSIHPSDRQPVCNRIYTYRVSEFIPFRQRQNRRRQQQVGYAYRNTM